MDHPRRFSILRYFSRTAFYAEKDPHGKSKKGVDVLSHEMSNALLEGYKSKDLSDPCRTLVLARLLSLFLSDNHGLVQKDVIGISYKMLTQIIQDGLKSAKKLDIGLEETSEATFNLLDNVWERVCATLSQMLSLALPNGSQQVSIVHPSDLVDIVYSSAENAPPSYSSDLCAILFSGATKCLEIVKKDGLSTDDIETFLNLFAACFSGMCKVRVQDRSMHGIAERVLLSAFQSLESAPKEVDSNVRSALKIFDVLKKASDVEVVVIAVFPQISQLVGVEERSVRRAAGAVLARTNIRGILEDAQNRCNVAEERARMAENSVFELEKQITELRK